MKKRFLITLILEKEDTILCDTEVEAGVIDALKVEFTDFMGDEARVKIPVIVVKEL